MTKQDRQVTSAREWKKPYEEGFEIELPSGHIVKLRPVPLAGMLTSGALPDLLTKAAAEAIFQGEVGDSDSGIIEIATSALALLDYVCKLAFVEPLIVGKIEDEEREILVEHVEVDDKQAVFQVATQPAQVLRKFRDEQARSLAALSDSEGDSNKAE